MATQGMAKASAVEQASVGSVIGFTEDTVGVRSREKVGAVANGVRRRESPSPEANRVRRPFWPLGLYRVAGESMLPYYRPGDTLIGWSWFRPHPGQVVVINYGGRMLVKRVVRHEAGLVWLEGDNSAASTDSRHFGAVPEHRLHARIIASLGQ